MRLSAPFKRLRRLMVRAVTDEQEHHLYPYRGYGSREEIDFMGRVFRQKPSSPDADTAGSFLVDVARRLLRKGLPNAVLDARFAGTTRRVTTDRYGYFHVEMPLPNAPPLDRLWHEVELELLEPCSIHATAHVFIPPASARFVVISDIDDTVIFTGVANKLKMLWRLFFESAESRVAFPGVGAFYRALHRGLSGTELNPILYVSQGPWGIYEVLDAFFDRHQIPIGPILFLREWGVTLRSPLPRKARDHKMELLRDMVGLYDHLPFILIGDSGQRDPEIYEKVVREFPGRVLGVYIRNVSRKPARRAEIDELAREVTACGSSLVLASDTFAMARHASEHGFIAPDRLEEVLAERIQQQGTPDLHPTIEVGRATEEETRKAVDEGEIETALEAETGEDGPPNVVVEPQNHKPGGLRPGDRPGGLTRRGGS